jgi:membrane protease YdiL (CAAX protease family)
MTEEQPTKDYASFEQTPPIPPAPPVMKEVLPTTINPDSPPWHWLPALGILFLSFALMVILGGVALVFYFALKGFPAGQTEILKDPFAIVINLVSIVPAHFLTILAAWVLVTGGGKRPFLQTLGWNWNGFGVWKCVGATFGLFVIGALIIQIFGEQENDLIRILRSSREAVFVTAFIATFTAPFAEEVVYRGVLYPALRKSFGMVPAILFVTLIFAGVHFWQYYPSYGTILVICLLSLFLTVVRAWTQSLLPCFVIHTIFNGVQSVLLLLEPYIPKSQAPVENPAPAFVYFFNV